jgi:hypothetical protein
MPRRNLSLSHTWLAQQTHFFLWQIFRFRELFFINLGHTKLVFTDEKEKPNITVTRFSLAKLLRIVKIRKI